ncbi:MAG: HAD family hydrolase [Aigarchaeota archaeon]|nr:HAD family hydrolase [Candidatus Pelearchaeum maunauluense]
MAPTNPKAIVFDIDGTLYRSQDYERQLYQAIVKVLSEMLNITKENAAIMLQDAKRKYRTVSISIEALGLDRHEFYQRLANSVEPEKTIAPDESTPQLLRKLKNMGYKIVLHTNSGRQLAMKILKTLRIDNNLYDLLVTSDEYEPKPSAEGYLGIVRQLGIQPSEIIYVGDRIEVELLPAKKLGMITVLLGSKPRSHEIDYTINSLNEILEVLNKLTHKN